MKQAAFTCSLFLAMGYVISTLGVCVSLHAEEAFEARLIHIEGSVQILPSGDVDSAAVVDATDETSLEEGDRISTGPESTAEISLDGESLISLGEKSSLTLTSPKKKKAEFFLALGSLIAKIKSMGQGQTLAVRTPFAVAAVRGTEFGVFEQGENQPTSVAVFDEGEVHVERVDGGESVLLKPQQELEVHRERHPLVARPLTTLAPWKPRMELARRRAVVIRENWKPRTREERLRGRQRWLQKHHQPQRPGLHPRPHQPPRSHPQRQRPASPQKRRQK